MLWLSYRTVYGLYVIDECNIETHGMKPYVGRLADDPDWADAYMQRLTRMFHRDRAHACIIGWSLGNEAGYGVVHDAMAAWLRERDSSRIVMYEPASYGPRDGADLTGIKGPDTIHGGAIKPPAPLVSIKPAPKDTQESSWNILSLFSSPSAENDEIIPLKAAVTSSAIDRAGVSVATDVVCPMYARVEECVQLSKLFPAMPLIQCEYAHMMGECACVAELTVKLHLHLFLNIFSTSGNSGGGLNKYWELYFNKKDHPRIQGGFIWDWVDQGAHSLHARYV